jgi:mercuric ion transport protein
MLLGLTKLALDRLKRGIILTLAVVACPCHLPVLLAVLGGTTIGAFLASNVVPVFVVLSAVFVGALTVGLRAFETGPGLTCAPDEPRIAL